MNRWFALLVAPLALVLSLAFVGAASAATGFERVGAFAEASPDGLSAHQKRIAVNHVSGDVYVTDQVNDQIAVYRPNGTSADPLTTFGLGDLTDPFGIAIDQDNGDVYVSDANGIVKYTSDGEPTPAFTKDGLFGGAGLVAGVAGALAFDQSADVLLIADTATNVVRRYDTAGLAGATFDGTAGTGSPGAFVGLQDIAVDSTGDVIVVDSTGNPARGEGVSRVERFASNGDWEATIGPVATAATVAVRPSSDEAIVSGEQDTIYSAGVPKLHVFAPDGTVGYVSPVDAGGSTQYATVSGVATAAGADGQLFAATDNADYFGGYSYGYVSVQVFNAFALTAPVVSDEDSLPSELGAKLSAKVNPVRSDTTWAFEYGATTGYGNQIPVTPANIPAGGDPVAVAKTIGGLTANTTYHYRLVASNAIGTTVGVDRTFTTRAPAVAGGGGTDAGRAYELVTPGDKTGTLINPGIQAQMASDGDGVGYFATGALPGATQSSLTSSYAALRSPDGVWASSALDPPQTNDKSNLDRLTYALSDDLSRSVQLSRRSLAPGAVEDQPNLYMRDNRTGAYELIVTTSNEGLWANTTPGHFSPVADRTADLGQFVLQDVTALTDDAVQGDYNIYHYDGEQLRLVTAGVAGGGLITGGLAGGRILSPDGKRVFFIRREAVGAYNPLYVWERDGVTSPISVSRRAGEEGELRSGYFLASAGEDGHIVYFSSEDPLTDDSVGNGLKLYRYDLDTGSLIDITKPFDGASASARSLGTVYGVAADGSQVYFHSGSKLVEGATVEHSNLYSWRDGTVRLVAELGVMDGLAGGEVPVGMSPSGRYLAFGSRGQPTGYDNRSSQCPGDADYPDGGWCYEVYVYDAVEERLACVTCRGDGRLTGHSFPGVGRGAETSKPDGSVGDDGTVFFTSRQALTAGDVNGVNDVYAWKDGVTVRVSSGRSASPSRFEGASADGKNVFFFTSERLSVLDGDDGELDLYDARVGGVSRSPGGVIGSGCDGDACQGMPTSSPGAVGPASGRVGGSDSRRVRRGFSVARLTSGQRASLAAGVAVRLKVTVGARARVRVSARARVSGKRRMVASGSATAARAGVVSVRLRLSRAARRQLARSGRLDVALSVRVSGVARPKATTLVLAKRKGA